MKCLAYCDRRFLEATRRVVGGGVKIITSPPAFAADVRPAWFEGYDVLYFDLHGQPGSVYLWSGPNQEHPALNALSIRDSDLTGCIVLATTCYLPETMFVDVFLSAGASAVIGGDGRNWGNRRQPTGAQLLARDVLKQLRAGRAIAEALESAQAGLRRHWHRWHPLRRVRHAMSDALEFRLFEGD